MYPGLAFDLLCRDRLQGRPVAQRGVKGVGNALAAYLLQLTATRGPMHGGGSLATSSTVLY